MKKSIFNHLTIFVGCALFLSLALATDSMAQDSRSGNVKTSIVKVKNSAGTAVIPQAGASMARNNAGVFGTIATSGLTPGTVVTLWWGIFNNPEYCANADCVPPDFNNPLVNGSLQYGGGYIVGLNGRAEFSGYLDEGDNTGFYLSPAFPNMPNPAPGIVDTKKAQIHMAIRTHGAASSDPVILNQQLTTFTGNCSAMPNPCATIQVAIFNP